MATAHETALRLQSEHQSESPLQALLLEIVQSLVDVPSQVRVSATEGDRTIVLTVTVAPLDVGKVIGKQGRIADALRTILGAAAGKHGKRALLEII